MKKLMIAMLFTALLVGCSKETDKEEPKETNVAVVTTTTTSQIVTTTVTVETTKPVEVTTTKKEEVTTSKPVTTIKKEVTTSKPVETSKTVETTTSAKVTTTTNVTTTKNTNGNTAVVNGKTITYDPVSKIGNFIPLKQAKAIYMEPNKVYKAGVDFGAGDLVLMNKEVYESGKLIPYKDVPIPRIKMVGKTGYEDNVGYVYDVLNVYTTEGQTLEVQPEGSNIQVVLVEINKNSPVDVRFAGIYIVGVNLPEGDYLFDNQSQFDDSVTITDQVVPFQKTCSKSPDVYSKTSKVINIKNGSLIVSDGFIQVKGKVTN